MTRMPWGKFAHRQLCDVPLSYLAWVVTEATNVSPYLAGAIRDELADRLDLQPAPRCHPPLAPDRARLADALATWHRKACLRWHPDRGGDERVMKALNDARDELAGMIASA